MVAHEANGYHVGQLGSRSSQMRERNTGAHNSGCEVYSNTGPYKVLLEAQETASGGRGDQENTQRRGGSVEVRLKIRGGKLRGFIPGKRHSI